jgi:hypothetical protein
MFETGIDKEFIESEVIDLYDVTVPLPKYDTGLLVRKVCVCYHFVVVLASLCSFDPLCFCVVCLLLLFGSIYVID